MSLRVLAIATSVTFALLTSVSSHAQSALPASGGNSTGTGSGPTRMGQDPTRPTDYKEIKTRDKTSRLFDLSDSVSGVQVDVGPVWYRPAAASRTQGFERGTGELAVGFTTTAPWKPFYLAGHHKLAFRAFDSKSYHTSLTSEMATGVFWGPLEVESRIGLNLVNLGAFHGEWSAELLSPRVAVAAAVHLWRFRVDIQAHSEYLWRWFGTDYLVRGITLGLRIDLPRSEHPLTKKSSETR